MKTKGLQTMKRLPWFVVTGRVSFDDEDSIFITQAENAGDAMVMARNTFIAQSEDFSEQDDEVYINYVVECPSMPRVVVNTPEE